MSTILGTITPTSGTGNKTFTIGVAATKIRFTVAGKSGGDSYTHLSQGTWITGGSQYVTNISPTTSDEPINGKVVKIRDSLGTTIFEASVSSTNATQIVLNFTVAPGSIPILLEIDY